MQAISVGRSGTDFHAVGQNQAGLGGAHAIEALQIHLTSVPSKVTNVMGVPDALQRAGFFSFGVNGTVLGGSPRPFWQRMIWVDFIDTAWWVEPVWIVDLGAPATILYRGTNIAEFVRWGLLPGVEADVHIEWLT